eukprot:symbB.v1.2.022859.t1/scaffold2046.1/size91195/2
MLNFECCVCLAGVIFLLSRHLVSQLLWDAAPQFDREDLTEVTDEKKWLVVKDMLRTQQHRQDFSDQGDIEAALPQIPRS